MTMVTDKNREEIIDKYVQHLLDSMSFKSLWSLAYDYVYNSKDLMDNEPLEQEILECCPEVLDTK